MNVSQSPLEIIVSELGVIARIKAEYPAAYAFVMQDHDCHASAEDGCEGCSEDYPLGGMIEEYDIEKEKEMMIDL